MSRNYAICVGINRYNNLQPLQYAVRDAESVRDFCLQEKFDQVYFFAVNAPPIPAASNKFFPSEPTFGHLEGFFDFRFAKPFLKPEDNLWFFFAGHGRREGGKDYLLPSDFTGNVNRTGLAIREIGDRLRNSGAGNVVMFLDACRNESSRRGEGIGLEQQQGVVSIFACSPNQYSYEIEALQQGAFTHSLLQGLRITGEGNCATVERLTQYLIHQVHYLCKRHGKVDDKGKPLQTPYPITEPASKLHLILLPEKANVADANPLKFDAQEAELEGDLDFAEELWMRVLAVSRVDSSAIKALQRIAVRRVNQSVLPKSQPQATSSESAKGDRASTPIIIPKPKNVFSFETATVNDRGEITNRLTKEAEYRREDLGNGVTLELVRIPAGRFMMGCPDGELEGSDYQKPQHEVQLKEFWLGKYPVTQAQWKQVAALPKIAKDLDPDPARFKGDDRPIERVSWYDAEEFCKRLSKKTSLNYRLPTEAEWEYACRAGTKTPFYFGETINTDLVNYDGNYTYGNGSKGEYRKQTTPVGQFPPNPWGLYDMHGNVWEWCLDHWHDSYQDKPTELKNNGNTVWSSSDEAKSRLLRGGSWDLYPWNCRSAYRLWWSPDDRDINYGFRVVLFPA